MAVACLVVAIACRSVSVQPEPAFTVPAGTIGDDNASRTLQSWVCAFNSGNVDSMRAFASRTYAPGALAERSAAARAESDNWLYLNLGRMRAVGIDRRDDSSIVALVQQEVPEGWGHLTLKFAAAPPHALSSRAIDFFEPAPIPFAIKRPEDGVLVSGVDAYARRLASSDLFSGVVAIAKRGQIIFQKAYGAGRRDPMEPMTTERRFQLASVSKMFTAVAIAQLVEQGRLSFEDTLAKLLSDYPNASVARRVTIAQLLTHSSGIPDYFRNPRYWEKKSPLSELKDFWPYFASESLSFAPGSNYEYTNSGYVLLGSVIERITHESFRTYIAEHVWRRANMTSTSYEEGSALPGLAVAYTKNFGPEGKPDPQQWHLAETPPKRLAMSSGGGTSTAGDLVSFMTALLDHRLVSKPMTDLILAEHVSSSEGGRGYGFESTDWGGTRIVGHNGFAPGAYNQVDAFPDRGYVVVVLSNGDTSGGGAVSYWLRRRLASR